VLNLLGLTHKNRYRAGGVAKDLDVAIEFLGMAAEATHGRNEDAALAVYNEANALRWRYLSAWDPVDLERAIASYRRAASMVGVRHRAYTAMASGLATALRIRGRTWGNGRDLTGAVHLLRTALHRKPDSDRSRADVLNNLCAVLLDRFDVLHRRVDIEEAVACAEQALGLLVSRPLLAQPVATNLAVALRRRWVYGRDPADLVRATELAIATLRVTSRRNPEWRARVNTVAGLHRERFLVVHDLPSVDAAIVMYRRALVGAGGSSAEMELRFNLGLTFRDRWRVSGDPADLRRAVLSWELLRRRLRSSRGSLPVDRRIEQVALWQRLDSLLIDGHLSLSRTGDAAAVRRAMAVAEEGKALLLAERMNRRPLLEPAGVPPLAIDEERSLLQRVSDLDQAEFLKRGSESLADVSTGTVAFIARRLVLMQLEEVWESIEASGRAGARYVAARRTGARTRRLPRRAGSVLLSLRVADRTTLAFVERGEDVFAITLRIGRAMWARAITRLERDRRMAIGFSWHKPLVDRLQALRPVLAGAEAFVVSPDGESYALPWAFLLARVIADGTPAKQVTVVPSVLVGGIIASARASHALVCGNTVGDLRHSGREARAIASLLAVVPLIGRQATRAAVIERLPGASPIHIASHAYFDAADPWASGVSLNDGILTAADFLGADIGPGLVVIRLSDRHERLSSRHRKDRLGTGTPARWRAGVPRRFVAGPGQRGGGPDDGCLCNAAKWSHSRSGARRIGEPRGPARRWPARLGRLSGVRPPTRPAIGHRPALTRGPAHVVDGAISRRSLAYLPADQFPQPPDPLNGSIELKGGRPRFGRPPVRATGPRMSLVPASP
jgi:hypothetical protein